MQFRVALGAPGLATRHVASACTPLLKLTEILPLQMLIREVGAETWADLNLPTNAPIETTWWV
jgi:hypothetical protein